MAGLRLHWWGGIGWWCMVAGLPAACVLLPLILARAQTVPEPLPIKAAWETRRLTDFYTVKHWRTEDGLPRNTINCLLQTADGYLWIGTRNGLARFDGVRFQIYDRENTPELRHNNILSLAENPPGTLWIGTMEGLARYAGHRFSWHAIGKRIPNRIWSIAPRKAGGVWLGTDFGPARFNGVQAFGHGIHRTPTGEYREGPDGETTIQVAEDAHGCLWARGPRLVRLPPGANELEVVYPPSPEFPPFGRAQGLLESAGAIWMGSELGLFRCFDSQFEYRPGGRLGFWQFPGPLCADKQGGTWLDDGDSGLSYLFGGKFTHYRSPTGLSDDQVNCALEDREGNLWLGTERGGLNRLQPRHLMNLTSADGLADDSVWSISEGPDGSIWIGTEGGLSRYSDGQFTTCQPTGSVTLVYAAAQGEVFAGNSRGLCRVSSNALVPVVRTELGTNYGLGSSCIYCDRSGRLWVATDHRLFRQKDGDWECVTGPDSKPLIFPFIAGLLEDATGALWVGTKNGVFRLRGTACDRFTPETGFPADYAAAVLADPDGTVWFASVRGLIRYRDGKFFLLTAAHGLFENLVLNALEDDFGWFWLNGHQGLQRVRRVDLNAVADGRTNSFVCLHYGEADGMLSAEGNGGALPNSCKTRDGRLWFPTIKGVVVVDPRALNTNKTPPPVVIEQVVANGAVIFGDCRSDIYDPPRLTLGASRSGDARDEFAQAHRLGPGKARTLLIHYTANSFMAPERVRFQYRLEGHDQDWVEDPAKLRTAIYTNLRPGQYRFRVRAFNNHGVQSTQDASFAFSLAPHFYETWAFYILCGCTLLFCAAGVHHIRLNGLRRIKELEQLHALDLERSRLSRDMHDNLGADLTRVMMLAEMGRPPSANGGSAEAKTLEKIAGLSRTMVDGISELVWATNPHQDRLEDVATYLRARAAEFLEPAGIKTRYDFPERFPDRTLNGEVRRQLLLAMKEALANLLKHSGATEVSLSFRILEERLTLTISDNGRGFPRPVNTPLEVTDDQSSVLPGSRRAGGGNGLANIGRRIAGVGGSCKVESAPGRGTTVRIEVPFGATVAARVGL